MCSTLPQPSVPGRNLCRGSRRRRRLRRREAQTEASFVANLFDTEGLEAMLYRTGDLGRWRPDGQLEPAGGSTTRSKSAGSASSLGNRDRSRSPPWGSARCGRRPAGRGRRGDHCNVARARQGMGREVLATRRTRSRPGRSCTTRTTVASESADLTRNTIGWDSTYTGLPIPHEEMRGAVDRTGGWILALGPRKTRDRLRHRTARLPSRPTL